MSVFDAASSGDRRLALEAMRDALAAAMDAAPSAVQAQLSGQLRMVLADLAALPSAAAKSKRDELKERRAAGRRATAPPVEPAKRASRKQRA